MVGSNTGREVGTNQNRRAGAGHRGARRWTGRISSLRLAVLVALALVGGPTVDGLSAAPAEARFEDPDIASSAHYTFEVLPDEGRVAVTIDLTLTATKPNQNIDAFTYRYFYFDGYHLVVPEGASEVVVVDGAGRTLSFEQTIDDGFGLLKIRFARNLSYRQTQTFTITFDLNGAVPRSEDPARVNEAYAGFPLWLSGNLEEATIDVVVPDGFTNSNPGAGVRQFDGSDGTKWHYADVDAEEFFTFASFAQNEALRSTRVRLESDDEVEIIIEYWPNDEQWARSLESSVQDGLSVLIDLVGRPWPVDGPLTIRESYAPSVEGYAGWYDSELEQIEMGDLINQEVTFHELTHAWFNHELFDERWLSEGLAELYANQVVEELGGTPEGRPRVGTTSPDGGKLMSWSHWSFRPEDEEWGYAASLAVMNELEGELGFEVVAEAVRSSIDGAPAYAAPGWEPGDPELEVVDGAVTWRRFLDLLENRGEVEDERVTDIFRRWVVSSPRTRPLASRSETRTEYFALARAGDTWAVPAGIRKEMGSWRFKPAQDLIGEAHLALESRDELRTEIEPLGVELPDLLAESYEAAEDDFSQVTGDLARATRVGGRLRAAHDAVTAEPSLVERLGLVGRDQQPALEQAAVAFEDGDLRQASTGARQVSSVMAGAATRGWSYLGAAAGLLLALGLGVWLLIRRRRRQRAETPDPGPDPDPDPDPPTPPADQPAAPTDLRPATPPTPPNPPAPPTDPTDPHPEGASEPSR